MKDFTAYSRTMRDYYDHSDNPVHSQSAPEHLSNLEEAYRTSGHWLREAALAMQEILRERRVLEVACGHGRWSLFAADTAEQITATDASPRLLAVARRLAELKGVPSNRLRFAEADAFHLAAISGRFNAGLVMNFFQHIPIARHSEFLTGLHRKIGAGVVFMGANRFSEGSKARLVSKPGEPDTYDLRHRPDGTTYEIIDNDFSPDDLWEILRPFSHGLTIAMNDHWWWLHYGVH
ncbi:MAG: class I SAM-dependent methyltransferase [Armatimonadetes bacterium]|nr:class I SAM-dependent methyltransferase [Armatimonadota bacterium]